MKTTAASFYAQLEARLQGDLKNYLHLSVNKMGDPDYSSHNIYRLGGVVGGLQMALQEMELLRDEIARKEDNGDDDADE